MKKILFISNVCKKFNNFSYSSMAAAKKLGFDFHIAVNYSQMKKQDVEDYEEKFGVTIHQIDFIRNPFNPQNYKAYKQMMKLLKNENFDLVHCNTPVGGIIGRICSHKNKVKKVLYMAHGFHFFIGAPFIMGSFFKWAEMILSRITDAIITINEEDFLASKKFKLKSGGKTYYVPGVGIEIEEISNAAEKRKELLQEIGGGDDSILIISSGEINKNKNNAVIINAIKKLGNSNIHYILCGEGPKKDELMSLARKKELQNNVHFLGYRSDVLQLLKSCDIYVLPSFREGLPRSFMEAMAAGLPCIVSEIRGNVDLISNGEGGFLCKPRDVNSFAKVLSMTINNRELRKKMGEVNKNKVKKYDVENVKSIIEKIYKEILLFNEGVK